MTIGPSAFLDTSFVVATLNGRDQHHARARALRPWLDRVHMFTTEAVLVEVANALAAAEREAACKFIDQCFQIPCRYRASPSIRGDLECGLALYRSRADKSWGLTDCISFEAMHEHNIREAFTAEPPLRSGGVPRFDARGVLRSCPPSSGSTWGPPNSVVACRNAYGRPEVIPNREGQGGHAVGPLLRDRPARRRAGGQGVRPARRRQGGQLLQAPHGQPPVPAPIRGPRLHRHRPLGHRAEELEGLGRGAVEPARGPRRHYRPRPTSPTPSGAPPSRRAGSRGWTWTRIINEPTAAALAYGLQRSGVTEDVLIYDPRRRDVRRDRGADHARGDRRPRHGGGPRPRRQELGRPDRHDALGEVRGRHRARPARRPPWR